MDRPLTTADVPPEFLEDTYMVGHIPLKAMTSDPRVSYTLYIPPAHYNSKQPAGAALDSPRAPRKLPLLIYVHGTRRNISAMRGELAAFADSAACAIAAPMFPAGLDGPNDLDSYKLLRSASLRSDRALLAMLDEIEVRWPGVETERVSLMGWSGGAQFALRFLYLYPERLVNVSAGAPGQVTHLDEGKKWPLGVADVEELFVVAIRKDAIARVRIQLAVGGADVDLPGGREFWVWLEGVKGRRSGQGQHKESGSKEDGEVVVMRRGRLENLQTLHRAWKEEGIQAQFDVVEGVGHDEARMRGCLLDFLLPLMQE
ncbi:Uu.00g076820.m01.CDS01 [Anthostomella pinea]|uniref:Uu.00g076820.m01.CDS01 n=1 Tax=Anthostomella pinea TaxID=933095 RepID=A0AAI8VVX9_9PEZI|nr:Uu.00g076820.m01.CDS01 [Anthostomella pinea]